MKHFILPILALAMGAGAVPNVTSMSRSARIFHQDATTKKVYADLLVAYEEPPTGFLTKATNEYLKDLMISVSQELSASTNGAVQLGKVMIIPATVKADPDILILNDEADLTKCPDDLKKPEEISAVICADSHTGGYVGTKWWEPATSGTAGTVFATVDQSLKEGARVSLSWNTTKGYGVGVLMHELGHYLFSMRDEYEGLVFADDIAFGGASKQDPMSVDMDNGDKGYALSGSLGYINTLTGGTFLDNYNGYAMNLVSKYQASKGYSPPDIDATVSSLAPEGSVFFGGFDVYAATEQISTVATRGSSNVQRHGGMWSLATTIQTALGTSYALPTTPLAYDATQEQNVLAFSSGQENIIVYDRSGSMGGPLSGDNPDHLLKQAVSTDFLARLTHDEILDPKIRFPSTARFGFVAFDDQIEEPFGYPVRLNAKSVSTDPVGLKDLTVNLPAPIDDLLWTSAKDGHGDDLVPSPRGATDLLGALALAKSRLDGSASLPVQRNIMLVTDGIHNTGNPYIPMTGDESKDGGYRLFAISVDSKLDGTNDYGTKLQKLATQSMGPDGLVGQAFYASGYAGSSSAYDGNPAVSTLADIANSIATAINGMDKVSFGASALFRDAAKEYSVQVDPTQAQAQFAISWSGSIAPTLYLSLPNGQTFTEGNGTGITFRRSGNFKSFDIDLSKYPVPAGSVANTWKLRVTAPNLTLPITIIPSFASKSTSRQVRVSFDPTDVRPTGRLPVSVVVQDGRPIEGLTVSATLSNRATGVIRTFPLTWNGAAYVGILAGNLQPGLNDLSVTVAHPNNGKVYYAAGENHLPVAQRTVYPYFASVTKSQQVWVAGGATPKSVYGLAAVTRNTRPDNAQGTSLKLFLRNKTTYTWTGLKARYYYSVSEFPNGVPGVNVNYLAGGSKVTVGTVKGRSGLAYVQFDFAGKTLNPGESTSFGTNGGEDVTLIEQSWRSPWDPTNDWSAQGLTANWSENSFINIYDASGNLIVGNPDLEANSLDGNAAPAVSISSNDFTFVGNSTAFFAKATDPERDPLTYAWSVNGTPVTGVGHQLTYTFSTPGTYQVSVSVSDGHHVPSTVAKDIVVQSAGGACVDGSAGNIVDLGSANANKTVSLNAGANCFEIKAASMLREWNWTKVDFQVNSDNGVALPGISVQEMASGTINSLSGYSQTVLYPDPGKTKNLYLKINATSARTVRLNWWLQ